MSIIASIVERYRGSTRIFECRRCGTTLCETDDVCEACGERSIAVYDL
ncbi:hypothetical protein [Halomarina rubra]|uniref:Small CPxCG-related zinc finger protein n=1 Tax=Halomarina rubra TaxID=2071873 RepID=A0ABD6B3V4_9EURY|nr:hypothetical protein [Halomarina rubra]